MKLLLLHLLVCLVCQEVSAQKEVRGRVVYAETEEAVQGAVVTLHPLDSKNVLGYAVAQSDGSFFLQHKSELDSFRIVVRAVNIEEYSRMIGNSETYTKIVVRERNFELNEVVVKAPKIRQMGDTLDYNVASFTDETDRTIGDVLKKLPGIVVLPSGEILYQNKQINKFYIEGLDMLQGRYGLATNNIAAKDVATVQVLENHEPIKVLKGTSIPEQAAINLKLKKSALGAFFANAQVGLGLPAWLLSNELVGMRFTRSQQNMVVYKGDNTGRNVAGELISFYDVMSGRGSDYVHVVSPRAPSIDKQHFLFNDAHLFSLNDLHKAGKEMTLTSNLNFLMDKHKSTSYARQDIFSDQDTILIAEDMRSRLLKRELDASILLEGNKEHYFLENKLRVFSEWNRERGDIFSPDRTSQYLKTPSLRLENRFRYIWRKGKRRYTVRSLVGYEEKENLFRVSPVLFEDIFASPGSDMRQDVRYSHLNSNTSVSWSKRWGDKYTLMFDTRLFTNFYKLKSKLYSGEAAIPDSLRNRNRRNEMGGEFEPFFMWKCSRNAQVLLKVPVKLMFMERRERFKDWDRNQSYLLFSPNLTFNYKFDAQLNWMSGVSVSKTLGVLGEDYQGYIMTTYRSLNRNDEVLGKSYNTFAYANLNYKNLITALFGSLRLSYSAIHRDKMNDVQYDGIFSTAVPVDRSYTQHSFSANLSGGQSIDIIRSEVKFGAEYGMSWSEAMNQGVISDFRSEHYSLSPSIVSDISNFFVMKYSADFRISRSKVDSHRLASIRSFDQKIGFAFIPIRKMVINLSVDHYYNNSIRGDRSAWFGNAGINYKWGDMELMLDWTNVFNTQKFTTYSYSNVSSYYSVYHLRHSEVMLRMRFKVW